MQRSYQMSWAGLPSYQKKLKTVFPFPCFHFYSNNFCFLSKFHHVANRQLFSVFCSASSSAGSPGAPSVVDLYYRQAAAAAAAAVTLQKPLPYRLYPSALGSTGKHLFCQSEPYTIFFSLSWCERATYATAYSRVISC
jgi:hypothetical protein